MSYGIYPEVKLALDSPDQFPAPAPEGNERRRNPSLTDTTSQTSTASTAATAAAAPSAEMAAATTEPVPTTKAENTPQNAACSFSFAAALKKSKQPAASAWGAASTSAAAQPTSAVGPAPSRRADSEESDNEDRVPVPVFQNSFSDAISMKLETLCSKENGDQASGKGGKKKKKKEKKLLFSTDMMRR